MAEMFECLFCHQVFEDDEAWHEHLSSSQHAAARLFRTEQMLASMHDEESLE